MAFLKLQSCWLCLGDRYWLPHRSPTSAPGFQPTVTSPLPGHHCLASTTFYTFEISATLEARSDWVFSIPVKSPAPAHYVMMRQHSFTAIPSIFTQANSVRTVAALNRYNIINAAQGNSCNRQINAIITFVPTRVCVFHHNGPLFWGLFAKAWFDKQTCQTNLKFLVWLAQEIIKLFNISGGIPRNCPCWFNTTNAYF